jgi:anti-sigma factor RsiW
LRDNPDDAAMVADHTPQRDALRAALAEIGNEPIPARLNPFAIRQSIASRRSMWRAAPAAPLAFGLGAEPRDDLAKWVLNRINHQVAPPGLSVAGYRFIGGGPAGMFMY